MLTINTNLSSFMAKKSLANSTKLLNQAIERMTTGLKINGAKDNAANFAITERMTTQLSALDVAEDNTAQGVDIVATANEALDLINERFTRLRNLAVQAENKTYGEESLKAINIECSSLVEEIKNVYTQAEYNGIKIFGAEFFETIPTDTTAPVAFYSAPESATFATGDTTLQELGIDYSSFQIYNSSNELIESYDTEKTDTLNDIFRVLSNYGITSSITDGVISISSSSGRYVDGDLMNALGIDLEQTDFVASSEQQSNSALYYTTTMTANEATTFAEIGALASGTDVVKIKDKYGDDLASFNVSSTTTLGGLFNSLGNYGIQGEIDDGVITLSSADGNYVLAQGVIANMGIGNAESSSAVTTGTSQTSSGVISYETVIASAGGVVTVQQEQTTTIWTTTTTSQTVTNTIWTTTTSSETQTNTVFITNTVEQTQTNTIWTTTTSSETFTETIWTTTTTSQTTTTPVTYTAIVTATMETTLGELGITDGMTYVINRANSSSIVSAVTTVTVQATDTIEDFINEINSLSYSSSVSKIEASFSNGIISLQSSYYDASYTGIMTGDVADVLGIGYSSFTTKRVYMYTNVSDEVQYTTINSSVVSTVTPGTFKNSVSRVDTSGIASLSSLAETDTITAGSTYKISTSEELCQFATMVENGLYESKLTQTATIILANNIDMSGVDWTGIASLNSIIFNGNGYVISNLTGSSGLFQELRSGSTIENLGLKDVNLTFSSGNYGGIINETSNNTTVTIDNCFVTGTFERIENTGPCYNIGGMIGEGGACISNSYTSITAIDSTTGDTTNSTGFGRFGGLIGSTGFYQHITITNCYTEGSLVGNAGSVGGIIGSTSSLYYSMGLEYIQSSFDFSATTADNVGGLIGHFASEGGGTISNAYFNGVLNDTGGAIIGEYYATNYQNITFENIGTSNSSYSLISDDNKFYRGLALSDTLDVCYSRNFSIVTESTDGALETIVVDKSKTIEEMINILEGYGLEAYCDDGVIYVTPFFNDITIKSCNYGILQNEYLVKNSKTGILISNQITDDILYETVCITTTSSTTQTETIWTTTTTSTTETETILIEEVTETPVTETIWTTTTSSTTQTETVWTTTTTSTTQTQTVDVTQTLDAITTTELISMTSDTTFADLGITSRAYITIMNDSTRKIITVKTADTIGGVLTKLNNAGITATLNDGQISLSPSSKKVHISGMSDSLKDALKLDDDFYTTSLGVDMTDSNVFIYDGETTIRQSTSLSDIGVTSGELLVKKDGQEQATIVVSESQTINDLLLDLRNAGFNAQCKNGVLSLEAEGDMVLTESVTNSSNAVSLFRLENVQQEIDSTFANKDSAALNKLSEIVNKYWKATSAIALQVGPDDNEYNRIEISTGFTIHNLDRFANIGKKMVNQVNYIDELDNILANISEKQTKLGASENRLMSVLEEISIKYDNLVSSRSTLRDADLADETSIYIQQQILQQASATLLSVANQTPQLALQLL